MATWIGGISRPSGRLTPQAKGLLGRLGAVVAEHDGWHTTTALALYHLAEAGVRTVLIVTAKPKRWFRLPDGWELQEPGLISPICRCQRALWLGPPEIAPLGSEAIWPCFSDNTKPSHKWDYSSDLNPEYPDYSGMRPGQLDFLLGR